MNEHKISILYRLYRPTKVWLNYLLDRIVDQCNMFLMDAYRFPWPAAQNVAQGIARYVGDVCCLLKDFPRLSAYELIGADWRIIFVGGDGGLRHIGHLFFEEEVDPEELGRIPLWKLSAQTQQWLAEGVDLVVCELSRIHPRPPRAALTFTVPFPFGIQQVLTIPERSESLIRGRRFSTERHRINKAKRVGFGYRSSKSKADFDHFYYGMHLPYVKARHGHLALITPYEDMWRFFLRTGRLLLVTQRDEPVAGVLCRLVNDTCLDHDRGVLEADPQLLKQGIETLMTWYAISWAADRGAKIFDMGGAHAWRSSGTFSAKRRWGARVARRRVVCRVWTFLAQDLSLSLQDHLGKLGFITEMDARFYGVLVNGPAAPLEEPDIRHEVLAAQREGLAGVAVTSPNGRMVICDSADYGTYLDKT